MKHQRKFNEEYISSDKQFIIFTLQESRPDRYNAWRRHKWNVGKLEHRIPHLKRVERMLHSAQAQSQLVVKATIN